MAKIKVLRVTSRADSFRRAGYQFTSSPTDIPLDDLDKKTGDLIRNEAALVSYETEIDVVEDDNDAQPKQAAGNRKSAK